MIVLIIVVVVVVVVVVLTLLDGSYKSKNIQNEAINKYQNSKQITTSAAYSESRIQHLEGPLTS